MRSAYLIVALSALWGVFSHDAVAQEYEFEGPPSREVLDSYLARSMTTLGILQGAGDLDDNIRLLTETGCKFAGRSFYRWGGEAKLPEMLPQAREAIEKIHAADPEIIVQACAFEIVTWQVDELPVPARVFEAFDEPVVERTFCYEDMFSDWGRGHWSPACSIPDISRPEAKRWFYYLATEEINIGCEAIHFGQVDLMARNDPERRHWDDVLTKVRAYAAEHARRKWVFCDGHVPKHGMVVDGRVLLDFHSFPMRIAEVKDRPLEGRLEMNRIDTIYGRSRGGVHPAGWTCEHTPYLVEFDNWGSSGRGGQSIGEYWTWGYDEISWFAHQTEEYRNDWLRYAWTWIRENDPNGFLQMPGLRVLHDPPPDAPAYYYAHAPSEKTPDGFNQESTIREIWAADAESD